MNMVALVPARAGSRRIPGKNLKMLAGHPLIAYTIAAAQQSGVFEAVEVWSDDPAVAEYLNAWPSVRFCQRRASADDEPDIAWVRVWAQQTTAVSFAILRPTSPFRSAGMIRRAFRQFTTPDQTADTLRAVDLVRQHPGKMWTWDGPGQPILPLLAQCRADGVPWHSAPTQSLPPYYVQTASLEMAWTWVVRELGQITGRKIAPVFVEGYEGFDLNTMADWREAEYLVASGAALLPELP